MGERDQWEQSKEPTAFELRILPILEDMVSSDRPDRPLLAYAADIAEQIRGDVSDGFHSFDELYEPELRFELSNGRVLCVECHIKTPNYGWRSYNKEVKWVKK